MTQQQQLGGVFTTEAQLGKELAKAKENLVGAEIALGGVSENMLKFSVRAVGEDFETPKAQTIAKEVLLLTKCDHHTENVTDIRQTRQELNSLDAQFGKLEHAQPTGGNPLAGRHRGGCKKL